MWWLSVVTKPNVKDEHLRRWEGTQCGRRMILIGPFIAGDKERGLSAHIFRELTNLNGEGKTAAQGGQFVPRKCN